jgi:phosphopantetheine--protein transferase-like protein
VRIAFRFDLPHGRCVGVAIPAAIDEASLQALLPEECAFAASLGEARRPTWVAGRIALRAALGDIGIEAGPILATDRGAPLLPTLAVGSISHKRTLAVALAAPAGAPVGIDLELIAPLRVDIARRVLTPEELASLAALAPDMREREVLLRLSCKEAIYKALDPFVRRYVAFAEVAVDPRPDGTAATTLILAHGESPFKVDVRWQTIDLGGDSYFLTTARVEAR